VDAAINQALADGARTRDIAEPEAPAIGTEAMGRRIADLIGGEARCADGGAAIPHSAIRISR
jgi:hypothetical protein